MGLTNSRKTAKRLIVSRKKVNCIKIPCDSIGMILMAASRKSHHPIEAFQSITRKNQSNCFFLSTLLGL